MEKRQANLTNDKECANVVLTKAQKKFIDFCQTFGWGKLEVVVKDGEPVMVTPLKQDFKMTD